MQTAAHTLLVPPKFNQDEYIHVTPQSAQWDHLSFAARRMNGGHKWDFETHENELALVMLGGVCQVTSNRGTWTNVGRRPDVFTGMPYTLYLPAATRFTVEAITEELD